MITEPKADCSVFEEQQHMRQSGHGIELPCPLIVVLDKTNPIGIPMLTGLLILKRYFIYSPQMFASVSTLIV